MHSSKQNDFEKFVRCVELIESGHHLSYQGLIDIAEITQTMNRQKPRTDLIRILRDYTPNIQDIGWWYSPDCIAICRDNIYARYPPSRNTK